jgi:hypothetical protein
MKGVSVQGKEKGKILTLDRLRGLPSGTLIPVEAVLDALLDGETRNTPAQRTGHALANDLNVPENAPQSWRTLLWIAPSETRIGREELLEAVGRPRSWVYRHTQAKAACRIPHRKLDGELVFLVGEVRAWLIDQEEIVQAGPLDTSPRLRALP